MVSRATMRPPMAAWIAIGNIWRGISSLSSAANRATAAFGARSMRNEGKGVDRFIIDQDIDHGQIGLVVAFDLVVEAGIAAADRFEPVVEIEYHLVERQAIDHHGPISGIGKINLLATPVGIDIL